MLLQLRLIKIFWLALAETVVHGIHLQYCGAAPGLKSYREKHRRSVSTQTVLEFTAPLAQGSLMAVQTASMHAPKLRGKGQSSCHYFQCPPSTHGDQQWHFSHMPTVLPPRHLLWQGEMLRDALTYLGVPSLCWGSGQVTCFLSWESYLARCKTAWKDWLVSGCWS